MYKRKIVGIGFAVLSLAVKADLGLINEGAIVEAPSSFKSLKFLDRTSGITAKSGSATSKRGLKARQVRKMVVRKTKGAVQPSKKGEILAAKQPASTDLQEVIIVGKGNKTTIVQDKSAFSAAAAKSGIAEAKEESIRDLSFKIYNSDKVSATKFSPEITQKTSTGHPYLSIMGGVSIAKVGKEQNDMTGETSYIYNGYAPANYSSGIVAYGINGGYEFNLSPKVLLSLGLGIYQNLNHKAKGKVYLVASDTNNHMFDYEYNLLSTRFMAEGQLAWQFCLGNKTKLIPFFSLGVGPSLNYVSNYNEQPVNQNHEVAAGFRSNTVTSLSYQVGGGVAFTVSDHSRLFTAYKYADLGQAHFNNKVDASYQLDVGKTKAHEIYFGYTYLFDF